MTGQQRLVITRTLAVVVALLLTRGSAAAQDATAPEKVAKDLSELSFEQLVDLSIDSVYSASAYAQKITEAPASVSIVTSEDIDAFGYRTLEDVLRSVRGFYVTNDRNYSYLGMRGFSRPGDYNARILLLVDGHRMNDNVFGSALLGTEFALDVDIIERIEIVRGPSSSLYGTSAFFAVINVITKKGEGVGGFDVAGSLGSFGTSRGRVSFGKGFANGAQFLLSGSAYESDGQHELYYPEFDTPESNFGVARDVDGDKSTHFLGKFRAGGFRLAALHGSRDKTVPTASFGTIFGDPRAGTVETQQFVDAQYERTLASRWHAGARVYYDRYAYDGTYPYPGDEEGGAPSSVLNLDFARGNRWGAEVTLRKRVAQRHTLAVGSEYRRNFRQDQYNYDVNPYHQYLDDRRSSTNWAVYVQDEMKLHERLLVNLGLRHDQYDTFGGTTNPRAALIYTPASRTTLKLLYGQAFRAPNAYELFWRQDDVAKANPVLRPETNSTSEFVLEQALTSAVRVGVTAFHYRVDDLISQQTDPFDELLVYNNVDRIDARGLELEAEGKWSSGLLARTSYTYQNSRNHATHQPLTNSPAHVAQALVLAPLGRPGLSAGFETSYLSERRTLAGNRVPSTVLANLTVLSRHEKSGMEISASLLNLFDEHVADPGSEEHRQDSIIQNGRTFRVNVRYRFSLGK